MIVRAFQKCSISNVLDKSNDDALQEEMSKGQHCCEWQSVNIASAHDAHLHDKNMCLSVNQEAVFFFFLQILWVGLIWARPRFY